MQFQRDPESGQKPPRAVQAPQGPGLPLEFHREHNRHQHAALYDSVEVLAFNAAWLTSRTRANSVPGKKRRPRDSFKRRFHPSPDPPGQAPRALAWWVVPEQPPLSAFPLLFFPVLTGAACCASDQPHIKPSRPHQSPQLRRPCAGSIPCLLVLPKLRQPNPHNYHVVVQKSYIDIKTVL